MLKKHEIDNDKYYDPEFYKFASYEVLEEYYPLIGELVSAFNSIESNLDEALVMIINNEIDEIGWIVISELSFASKLKTWKKLILWIVQYLREEEKKNELADELRREHETIIKKLEDLAQIRNNIVHADWDGMNESLFVKTKTTVGKKGVVHNHISINKEEFNILIMDFSKAEDLLIAFNKRIQALI